MKLILTQAMLAAARTELARIAGQTKSKRKAASSRRNGKRGGRPKQHDHETV
jgi:hypothetical protein